MRIATWNINSVKARSDLLVEWLKSEQPDVLCLQEIKCEDHAFPSALVEDLGYQAAIHGQKTYNGVAILSRHPIEVACRGLPGEPEDSQARYLEALIQAKTLVVRVASIYLPNGNPLASEKFPYKLRWMDRLAAHAASLLRLEEVTVLAGDYNVIPTPADARHPENWASDALFQPESRQKLNTLLAQGWSDAIRQLSPGQSGIYTFWDYQAGAWPKNNGIRIDHQLLSPQAADRLLAATVARDVRGWDHPSDHVPVVIEIRT